ncbi:hypothetical protein BJP40_19940 [Streptomyces sp. CC53]|uniref:hypothetical protein n=1 Tax=Streptomyces sp. CC53 TaxID=1906740 RepID=UPI0008DD4442|nr:hypothetical protein [Streptomyces sp. CC53]OII64612.1 hypothetical protein BJP40_19940 [Streptomyces sp. CC53]
MSAPESPRRPHLDQMTDDDLDALYARLEALEEPAPASLRDQYATAIHADLNAHKGRLDQGLLGIVPRLTDAVLAVRDTEMQQLRDETEQLRADCQRWADCAASAEKTRRAHAADADQYEAQLRARLTAAEQRAERAEAALDRVRAALDDLCDEPHPSHDHLCPDDIRARIRAAVDEPTQT